ncbi:MAG: AAA family ATPase [Halobacteriales archaeon]|nr:AAA family ATPase [Halobacteriales archaeon]
MFQAPTSPSGVRLRERILVMGSFGTGKTYGWLKIAEWMQRTESPGHVYVIDTDRAAERMLAPGGDFDDLANVTVRDVYEWTQYQDALEEFLPILTEHDWLVIDFVGSAWSAVQDWYVETIYDSSIDEFFLQARLNMKSGNPLDGWKDWSVINRVYKKWMDKIVHRTASHVYMTAVADPVRDTDDQALRQIYGRIGARPRGQKDLGHHPHTVALNTALGNEWYMTTVKDRSRPLVTGKQINDFAIDYLVNIAGWSV